MGKLYFKYGTMGSAKSLMLLTQAHSLSLNDNEVLCLKPSIDTRDGESKIKSRVGIERDAFPIKPGDDIQAENCETSKKLWILVDEAQFLTPEQVEQLAKIVDDNDNINVFCYGLRTDFRGEMFPGSKRLMELSDNIEEVKSTCQCGRKAIINARFDNKGFLTTRGEQVCCGDDIYRPLCRKCYNKYIF